METLPSGVSTPQSAAASLPSVTLPPPLRDAPGISSEDLSPTQDDLVRHKRIHLVRFQRHRVVKGCGEKVRDPGPSNVDKSRPAPESRVESPDAHVSINTTSGFSFRDGPLPINQDIKSGTNINMETTASPSVYDQDIKSSINIKIEPTESPSVYDQDIKNSTNIKIEPTASPSVYDQDIMNSTNIKIEPTESPSVYDQDIKSGTNIKMKTPESPSVYDKSPPSPSWKLPPSPSPGVKLRSPPPNISPRKSKMIESIVQDATNKIKAMLLQARGSSGSTSDPPSQDPTPGQQESRPNTARATTGNDRNPKRKMDDRGYSGTDDEDEDTGNHGPKDPATAKGDAPRYACPYFKYNPSFYKSARGCPGPGWLDIHRVKEHLYRRHKQPKYRCGRCWQSFKDQAGHLDHQRMPQPCSLREIEHIEGFDAVQEGRLRSRKKAKGVAEPSETEKWRDVYKILFPQVEYDDMPSPFYEYGELVAANATGPRAPGPDRLGECEAYILRVVPPRLHQDLGRAAERNFGIVEEARRREATACIEDIIAQAFREFRSQPPPGDAAIHAAEEHYEEQQSLETQPGGQPGDVDPFAGLDLALLDMDPFVIMGNDGIGYDGDGLLEGILRPIDDAGKLSDSGYDSGSLETHR
ncbi:hypothetical protein B0T24DRAFT_663274 [Lasiosphaeria ovina]|uniref:C2H2-type domain-containing protein n=1 Tax=Lasiosphaeria ovina TaxID=92902 RepID=A0AAE0NCK9_9PEZI|nr:hypothetical protein B0T24DRAFT_663274 [Lasiosphaeria ovina]